MIEFVADLGGNLNGDLARSRQLIRMAASVGCTAVVCPLFRIEQLYATGILRVSPEHRRLRHQELPLRFIPQLCEWAHDSGLKFGITVHDLDSVESVQTRVDFLSISPFELPWLDLIDRCADTGLPLVLDTGMAEAGEVWNAIQTALEAGCTDLTLLRSVARYPAPEASCNLASLGTLRELLVREFAPLYTDCDLKAGWCDHSVSPGVIARAVNHWGCDMVSFRFDLEGSGESFGSGDCWLPDRIGEVIAGGFLPVRRECDGNGRLAPDPGELEERRWRADPGDGLRPVATMRKTWSAAQPEATRRGPDIYLVCAGPGTDSLQRCLAVAESLRDDQDADILFLVPDARYMACVLDRHGFNWSPYKSTAEVVSQIAFLNRISSADKPPVCVIDLAQGIDQLASDLRSAGVLVFAMDPMAGVDADLCLVPDFGWRPDHESPEVFGGSKFLPIPTDILALRARQPQIATPGDFPRVVVHFDETVDHDRVTPVLIALHRIMPHKVVQAALGGSGEAGGVLPQLLASRFPSFEIISDGDPVAPLLAAADVVITGPGLAAQEALCLGIPVLLMADAEPVTDETTRLVASGAAVDLGRLDDITDAGLLAQLREIFEDVDRLSRLRFHAQELAAGPLDGHGAARVADRIARLSDKSQADQPE